MTLQSEQLSTKRELDWMKILHHFQILHCASLLTLFYIPSVTWTTIFFLLVVVLFALLGVTAGSHRLWAHRSYVATPALKVFLMLCQTLACHGPIYNWVRWHRLHHQHFGTDLDPYNPSKGFWYAHVIGLIRKLSPAQEKALEEVDMSDIEEDKVVMFQKKYYIVLLIVVGLLLPMNAPAEYWGENLESTVIVMSFFRLLLISHVCNAIHSATRVWGLQPGEKYPADTNLVFILKKTNWLSYHYMAPWDYQTSEYGKYGSDCVSKFIRICVILEYAYDLKTVDSKSVRKALSNSVTTKKSIAQCLEELQIVECQKVIQHF